MMKSRSLPEKPRQGGRPAPPEENSELLPYVSLDIFSSILLCLPVKTLSRFRCVCKSWSSLISSHLFQREYDLRWSELPPSLLLLRKGNIDDDARTITLDLSTYNSKETAPPSNFAITIQYTAPNFSSLCILSCRELVCIASRKYIYLLNPSTHGQDLVAVPAMLTDPQLVLNYCHGFGYASSSQQFKVVRFFVAYEDVRRVSGCEIFTVGTGRWRNSKKPPFYFTPGCAPFLHGAFHFLPYPDGHDKYIAVLDIETEEYRRVPLPGAPALWDGLRDYCLSELGGVLSLMLNFRIRVDLWMLQD